MDLSLGDNQKFVNKIWSELGFNNMASLTGVANNDYQKLGYDYWVLDSYQCTWREGCWLGYADRR